MTEKLSTEDQIFARITALETILSAIVGREIFREPSFKNAVEKMLQNSEAKMNELSVSDIDDPIKIQVEKAFQIIMKQALEIGRPLNAND